MPNGIELIICLNRSRTDFDVKTSVKHWIECRFQDSLQPKVVHVSAGDSQVCFCENSPCFKIPFFRDRIVLVMRHSLPNRMLIRMILTRHQQSLRVRRFLGKERRSRESRTMARRVLIRNRGRQLHLQLTQICQNGDPIQRLSILSSFLTLHTLDRHTLRIRWIMQIRQVSRALIRNSQTLRRPTQRFLDDRSLKGGADAPKPGRDSQSPDEGNASARATGFDGESPAASDKVAGNPSSGTKAPRVNRRAKPKAPAPPDDLKSAFVYECATIPEPDRGHQLRHATDIVQFPHTLCDIYTFSCAISVPSCHS
jgi:hypothetical protein